MFFPYSESSNVRNVMSKEHTVSLNLSIQYVYRIAACQTNKLSLHYFANFLACPTFNDILQKHRIVKTFFYEQDHYELKKKNNYHQLSKKKKQW